jgi:hypothetical protein
MRHRLDIAAGQHKVATMTDADLRGFASGSSGTFCRFTNSGSRQKGEGHNNNAGIAPRKFPLKLITN